ncbi:MAG TPA: AAA family ATPase [Candidatus Thiothrix moscowensis]|uniref:AAA family ATPase n=1 Tax=unclassified Thiothrix TaxID=2636184 RepID=UPI0025F11A88|nr:MULTISPECIES: AAA family ATPase [unclassified Thiothrix]HRJ53154.1 AAA family ATPase [Candidatus Thiothrix moscowensis]HRJ93276.1 AAA family ATPase [Candidatus Thiothrix moscowensis]
MAMIQGIRIKNFKGLKDVTLGKLWNAQDADPLTPMTVVIGKNGTGKSSLFDAFGFLADCLRMGVEEACDMRGRGGYEKIHSQGKGGGISFEIYYKQDGKARPITFEIEIDLDNDSRPYVKRERLRQRRRGQDYGRPFSFLILNEGKGIVWKGEAEGRQVDEATEDAKLRDLLEFLGLDKSGEPIRQEESSETEVVELTDKRRLGLATLASLRQHPRISAFRDFVEGWYLSYFTPDAARSIARSGPQRHLNIHGDNLSNVVQFMERDHPKRFQIVLNQIAEKIPGIGKISTHRDEISKNLYLLFENKGFSKPFSQMQMSDGTLKVFAYLLLLEDPSPPPFLCIEEPENGLYHKLLETLANEFRKHATGRKGGSQVFITTHQPYFVDALSPEEVWILEKGMDGFSVIRRASDDSLVKSMVQEGLPLGGLWYSDYLDSKKLPGNKTETD